MNRYLASAFFVLGVLVAAVAGMTDVGNVPINFNSSVVTPTGPPVAVNWIPLFGQNFCSYTVSGTASSFTLVPVQSNDASTLTTSANIGGGSIGGNGTYSGSLLSGPIGYVGFNLTSVSGGNVQVTGFCGPQGSASFSGTISGSVSISSPIPLPVTTPNPLPLYTLAPTLPFPIVGIGNPANGLAYTPASPLPVQVEPTAASGYGLLSIGDPTTAANQAAVTKSTTDSQALGGTFGLYSVTTQFLYNGSNYSRRYQAADPATNNTGVAASGVSSVGAAAPVICNGSKAVNISTATTTSIIAVSGSTTPYICGFSIYVVSGTLPSFQFEYGTGASCTSPTVLTGTYGGIAGAIGEHIVAGGAFGYIFKGAASSGICILSGGTTPNLQGFVSYTQF